MSFFTFRMMLPSSTTPPKIQGFQQVAIPGLSDLRQGRRERTGLVGRAGDEAHS